MNKELFHAYKWNRYHACGNSYPRKGPNPASEALRLARADIANGKSRYPSAIYSAVTWQPEEPGLAYVENVEGAGLREVGRVMPECGGRNGIWDTSGKCGWYTCPNGDVYKDGSGLCYGVVYQLPARNGKARFVPGYEFGGTDGGPTFDMSGICESEERGDYCDTNPRDREAAIEAAMRADSMAHKAAEEERAYQTAWQAGSQFADLGESVDGLKEEIRELLAERKAAKALGDKFPVICETLRCAIVDKLESIADYRRDRAELKSGDYGTLVFYPDETARAAFNEGAGETVL